MKRLLLIVLAAFLLVGCKTVYIDRIEYRFNPVPEKLMQDCKLVAPPDAKAYMAATPTERELQTGKVLKEQYREVRDCNIDKASLRDWNTRQLKLIEEANNGAKK